MSIVELMTAIYRMLKFVNRFSQNPNGYGVYTH